MRPVVRTLLAAVFLGVALAPMVGTTTALAARTPKAPPGYVVENSAPIPIPPGQAGTGGSISCPPGTVPWSGGESFTGGFPSVGENINSSAPTDVGWTARYNNSTSRPDDNFAMSVVCADRPPAYTTTFKAVDNPAGTQSFAIATCPAGTVVLGGGGLSSSVSPNVELLSSWPQSMHKFKAIMWNGSAEDDQLTTFVVCGQKPLAYSIAPVTVTDDGGPNAVDFTGSVCPLRTAVVGGGVHVSGAMPEITLGESMDDVFTGSWESEVINNGVDPATSTTYAICAA